MPKKIERGDLLVSSGFVGYVKIVKNERGDLEKRRLKTFSTVNYDSPGCDGCSARVVGSLGWKMDEVGCWNVCGGCQ